jgi:ATPase subunit of ABC transporter with duplicated ATPase domains
MSIRVERVAFAFSDLVPLLTDVSLHIGRGFTGVVGANGGGKTTLLRLITGELAPTSGTIHVDGVIAICPQALPDLAMSPGEARQHQLEVALRERPDVLILDEPTNHVDAAYRARLIGMLRRYPGVGVIVSHDRALLDELTTSTIRIHDGTAQLYPGNYSAAKQTWEADESYARDRRDDARAAASAATRKLVRAREDRAAAEANRHASKRMKGQRDHDATSMGRKVVAGWAEHRLGRHVEVARRAAERAVEGIPDAPGKRELGRSLFVGYERCPRRYLFEHAGDVPPVLRDVRVAVGAGDRIWIRGDNGAGKTTLIRALLANHTLPADRLLVLPQELDEPDVDAVRALRPLERGRVLSLVAALGVDPDRLLASESPSPGEARKLALALGLGRHAWCLVLDEPTNHLDLPSIERLEEALAAYPGALVVVSHDEAFARRCTSRTWLVEGGRVFA